MVDRPQTKFLIVFLTALVSLSVMSVSVLAIPIFKDFRFLINGTTENRTYNATQVFNFQINITNRTTDANGAVAEAGANIANYSIANVSWVFLHQNGTSNTTFTFNSAGIGGCCGSARNVSYASNTSTGIFFLNISQALLGPAGNWYLLLAAWENNTATVSTANYSASNFSFYIPPSSLNLTLRLNGTDGNRTYEFTDPAMIAEFNVTVSNSSLNATGEKIFVFIDTNISSWTISAGALTNISTATTNVLANFNTTTLPLRSNTTYNITASLTGGTLNFTASSVTLILTAKDNQLPSISISKPAAASAFTESSMILNFGVSDNAILSATTCNYKVGSGSFKSATPSKDISIVDLASGEHTITIQCDDASSNRAERTVKFSINLIGAPGGVPAAAVTPVVSTPSEDKAKVYIAKVVANKETTIAIDKGDVTSVSILVNSPVNSVYIDVNRLDAKPADVADAPGKVFRYLDIRSSVLTANVLDKAKIKFKVAKSWITENKADATKIYLNRFADGKWNRLDTTKDSEDANSIVYLAESPGFSTFAIAFEEAAPPQPTPTAAPTPTPTPAPTPTPTPAPTAAPVEVPGGNIGIILVIVVVVIVAVVLLRAGVI